MLNDRLDRVVSSHLIECLGAWDGPNHFVEVHLIISGQFDAMGVALNGSASIFIRFNPSLAWTQTSSTDAHVALYRLRLDHLRP